MNDFDVPMQRVKEAMRAVWMAGDFGVVARTIATGGAEGNVRLWNVPENHREDSRDTGAEAGLPGQDATRG